MRRLHHFVSADEGEQIGSDGALGHLWDTWAFVPGTATAGKNFNTKTMLHEMGTTAWWGLGVQNEQNTRQLQGEIHLSADLEPTCTCKVFTVEVNFYYFNKSLEINTLIYM